MTGIELIAAERKRQIEEEGWTASHDAQHDQEELATAAAIYALPDCHRRYKKKGAPKKWPWERKRWEPSPADRKRELVKAGALIVAALDRVLSEEERESSFVYQGTISGGIAHSSETSSKDEPL